jgi:TRAP-type C4-dicarboxylate transport system substrate-binding protein
MDREPGKEILASLAPSMCIGLVWFDNGARCIYSNRPIRNLADARNLKIRVLQTDLWMAIASAMGAKAAPMEMDQVVTAVRTGLIDAAENSIVVFDSCKHYEVFKYFCRTEHAIAPDLLVFSKKRWDTLSREDQILISEAASEASGIMRRHFSEREGSVTTSVVAAGTVFINDVDKTSFQNAMRPVYDKFVLSPQQQALFQAIKAIH